MNHFILLRIFYTEKGQEKTYPQTVHWNCIAGYSVTAILAVCFSWRKAWQKTNILVFRSLQRATQGAALRIRNFLKKSSKIFIFPCVNPDSMLHLLLLFRKEASTSAVKAIFEWLKNLLGSKSVFLTDEFYQLMKDGLYFCDFGRFQRKCRLAPFLKRGRTA